MKRKQDVAWGFFRDSFRRKLESFNDRSAARYWHAHYENHGYFPGPIFRITPPKRRVKGGMGRK